jgi:hypothetical protein
LAVEVFADFPQKLCLVLEEIYRVPEAVSRRVVFAPAQRRT